MTKYIKIDQDAQRTTRTAEDRLIRDLDNQPRPGFLPPAAARALDRIVVARIAALEHRGRREHDLTILASIQREIKGGHALRRTLMIVGQEAGQ